MSTSSEVAQTDTRETDAALIQRSCHEPEHFGALFHRHAAEVHGYIARRLGREPADDLVAETFLIAFRGRQRYDLERENARPWLYGIATNLVGRHRRSEVRQYRALARVGVDPVTPGDADRIVARVAAEEAHRRIADALAGLAARDRDVLLLIAWGDLTYQEAAQALGSPIGTVRSRLSRARRKVREALGGVDPTVDHEGPSHG